MKSKKKKNNHNKQQTKVTVLNELNINKEIEYILRCIKNNDSKIVKLNELLLFSTDTGDAWILDIDDKKAICLMKNFEKQSYNIYDTPKQFVIEWKYKYIIENETFIIVDDFEMKEIIGYPIKEICEYSKGKFNFKH